MDKIIVGARYQQFKGNVVTIISRAKYTEEKDTYFIIYRRDGDTQDYARPESMFFDDVSERKDNITGQKTRFVLLEE